MYALRTTHYRQTLLAVLTGLTTLPAASPLLSQVRIDTIALTGQEAPGFEPARFSGYIDGNWNSGFSEHRKPYINNSGQVLFGGQAYSYPLGDLYDDGVWATEQDDQLRLVRRERMAAPGTNFEFGECNDFDENNFCRRQHPDDSMQILGLSDAGEAVFSSSLVGPDVNVMNYQGIWSERGAGGLHLVVREGDPTPGTADTFRGIRTSIGRANPPNPTNDDGLVTFSAEFGSDRNRRALWVEEASGALRHVAQTGDPAPGTDGHFDNNNDFIGHIDARGNVAFYARYSTTTGESGSGIWLGTDQILTPVVVKGDPVPDVAENRFFDDVYLRSSSDSGNLVFSGSWLSEPDLDGRVHRFSGLFAASEDGIRKVERTGGDPVIDNQGRVALSAGDSVFAERDGALMLVAGPNTLPGLAPNEVVLGIRNLSANASGELAFSAYFEVPCEDPDDPSQCSDDGGEGRWIVGEGLEVSLVARTGSSIEVSPDDRREVYHVGAFNAARLNDLGQITFRAQFLDGTQGVFRAQVVPEPTSSAMLLAGLLWFAAIRTRRRRTMTPETK